MDQAAIEKAAGLLVEARRTGKPLRELPADCKPSNAAEANAIGDAVARMWDEPIAGWKITFVYRPRETPLIAPLFPSRIFAAPARIPVALTPSMCIEPEITFRLVKDLPPRDARYQAQEVAEAVLACPSFEVVDTRFDTGHLGIRERLDRRATQLELFADHQTSGAFVVGKARADWREVDFARTRVVMRADDETIVESLGGHAFSDPFLPLVVLANEMRRREGLAAGQQLATGSFTGFFPVAVNRRITATFEDFGSVEAMFVED